jgi:curved DNA-binding protein CbpA
MNTLYDILGVGRLATPAQIDSGYNTQMAALAADDSRDTQDGLQRLRVLKEAYLLLSSPAKRTLYDRKLREREMPVRSAPASTTLPWGWILLGMALLGGGGAWQYISHKQQARMEKIRFDAEQAAAAAKVAAQKAALEASSDEDLRLREARYQKERDDAVNRRLSDDVRREGNRIHNELQYADAQAARERRAEQQQAEYSARRAQIEAEARARSENARMERALRIPYR